MQLIKNNDWKTTEFTVNRAEDFQYKPENHATEPQNAEKELDPYWWLFLNPQVSPIMLVKYA